MRIGASAGSDTDRFLGGIHLGYEQNYTLRHGWKLFWQVKTDVMIKGEDLFRTGIVLGVKLPVNDYAYEETVFNLGSCGNGVADCL